MAIRSHAERLLGAATRDSGAAVRFNGRFSRGVDPPPTFRIDGDQELVRGSEIDLGTDTPLGATQGRRRESHMQSSRFNFWFEHGGGRLGPV